MGKTIKKTKDELKELKVSELNCKITVQKQEIKRLKHELRELEKQLTASGKPKKEKPKKPTLEEKKKAEAAAKEQEKEDLRLKLLRMVKNKKE